MVWGDWAAVLSGQGVGVQAILGSYMAKVRNIIGDFRVEVAARKRKCDVKKDHEIAAGESHFAYEKVPGQRKNVCKLCAPDILQLAQDHLSGIIKALL